MMYALTQHYNHLDEDQYRLAIKFLNRLGYQIIPRMNGFSENDEIPKELREIVKRCFCLKRETTRRVKVDGEWKQPYELSDREIFGIAGIVLWNLHQANGHRRILIALPEWRENPVLTALNFILRQITEDSVKKIYRCESNLNPKKMELAYRWNDAAERWFYQYVGELYGYRDELGFKAEAPGYLYRQIIGDENVTSEMIDDGVRYWEENWSLAGCFYSGKFSSEFNPATDDVLDDAARRIFDLSMMRNGPTKDLSQFKHELKVEEEGRRYDERERIRLEAESKKLVNRLTSDEFLMPFIVYVLMPAVFILPVLLIVAILVFLDN